MAIKIIKPSSTVFKMQCMRCDCEFSYEFEDIREDRKNKGNEFALVVSCPSCTTPNRHQFRVKSHKNTAQ